MYLIIDLSDSKIESRKNSLQEKVSQVKTKERRSRSTRRKRGKKKDRQGGKEGETRGGGQRIKVDGSL